MSENNREFVESKLARIMVRTNYTNLRATHAHEQARFALLSAATKGITSEEYAAWCADFQLRDKEYRKFSVELGELQKERCELLSALQAEEKVRDASGLSDDELDADVEDSVDDESGIYATE